MKKRGVTARKGNQIPNHLMDVEVRYMGTDSYDDICAEMDRISQELGRRVCKIPCGGSSAPGTMAQMICKIRAKEKLQQIREMYRLFTGRHAPIFSAIF